MKIQKKKEKEDKRGRKKIKKNKEIFFAH